MSINRLLTVLKEKSLFSLVKVKKTARGSYSCQAVSQSQVPARMKFPLTGLSLLSCIYWVLVMCSQGRGPLHSYLRYETKALRKSNCEERKIGVWWRWGEDFAVYCSCCLYSFTASLDRVDNDLKLCFSSYLLGCWRAFWHITWLFKLSSSRKSDF